MINSPADADLNVWRENSVMESAEVFFLKVRVSVLVTEHMTGRPGV